MYRSFVYMRIETAMRIALGCLSAISLVCPLQAYAISIPQWDEFAKGEFIDKANVKVDGDIVAAYVRHVVGTRRTITLYEVDCKGDRIRIHSDRQRYRWVPVEGGGRVLEADDGFRAVVPGSGNARIENAVCEIVAQQDAQRMKREEKVQCERAKHDDELRVFLLRDRLSEDEALCLLGLTHGDRPPECGKAGIQRGTGVVEYLHGKGIFLTCEHQSGHQ